MGKVNAEYALKKAARLLTFLMLYMYLFHLNSLSQTLSLDTKKISALMIKFRKFLQVQRASLVIPIYSNTSLHITIPIGIC